MNSDCLKLTCYFAERDRSAGRFLSDALVELCARYRLQASALLRGVEGFGRHQVLQSERLLSLSEDLPMTLIAVDARERIEAMLPELSAIATHGLITLERARLLSGPVERVTIPDDLVDAVKLTVYCGRHERSGHGPAFAAIVERLRALGMASAAVLLGVDGTIHGVRRRARFFARNAEVPLVIIAVGNATASAAAVSAVAELLEQPLMTLERVRICKLDGHKLAEPQAVAGGERGREQTWVKLMVHADQDTRHGRRPLYAESVRRLRQARADGATVLQGIWGYHGARQPQGDKLLSLRRHVPTTTVVIDTGARIGRWFQILDELTDEAGVITSELVPAFHARGDWGETGGLVLAPWQPPGAY